MNVEIIANTILEQYAKQGIGVTHIQMQKLLYILHGYYLARTGDVLIDEPFEAWGNAAVNRKIYSHLATNGDAQVGKYLPLIEKEHGKEAFITISKKDDDFWVVFEQVLAEYGNLSGVDLVKKAHDFDAPIRNVKYLHGIISNDDIKACFEKHINMSI